MTTPGQQLTPGDDQNPPEYGVPEGAYVGDAGSPNAIHDLNNLTEAEAKNRMRSQVAPSFIAQRDGIWGFFNSLLAIIQGGVNLVVGAVDAVVGGIKAIFNSVGSLFGAGHRDTARVDAARVAAENAIVDNLGDALDQLDEIQRAGGAYMDYEMFQFSTANVEPHVLPLNAKMDLQEGTAWVEPVAPLTHSHGYKYNDGSTNDHGTIAQGSGYLELLEPGFWRIDFQAALLQAPNYYADPAEVWCYVTAANDLLPVGAPGTTAAGDPLPKPDRVYTRNRQSGALSYMDGGIIALGRASSYVDQRETNWGGGNTVSGSVFALLPSGGYKVSMACSAFEHFSGGSSTFVMATKINSESLRDDIEDLKVQLAAALPGNSVPLDLDEASIAAMVSAAADLEVPEVEVPNE